MTPVNRLSASAAPLHDDSFALLEHVASLLAGGEDARAVLPRVLESLRALSAEMTARAHQVEAQRRFIEKIIDSLPLGIHVIDRDYRIQAWNRKRETGTQGISREEAIGRTIFEVLHRQPGERLRREFEEVFETGRIGRYEMESLATGEPRYYRVSKIPMRIDDEGISHVITIGEDVTEQKQARERAVHAEKLAAVGQLAAGVMHEIN
ncbi:MAG: PAS domain-containing protein, partial [Gemmatimonadaceae bacterium]